MKGPDEPNSLPDEDAETSSILESLDGLYSIDDQELPTAAPASPASPGALLQELAVAAAGATLLAWRLGPEDSQLLLALWPSLRALTVTATGSCRSFVPAPVLLLSAAGGPEPAPAVERRYPASAEPHACDGDGGAACAFALARPPTTEEEAAMRAFSAEVGRALHGACKEVLEAAWTQLASPDFSRRLGGAMQRAKSGETAALTEAVQCAVSSALTTSKRQLAASHSMRAASTRRLSPVPHAS